jgi:hypothetical protein
MTNSNQCISNQAALKRVGIGLLPGEQLDGAVELEGGMTDVLEPAHARLLLGIAFLLTYAGGIRGQVVISAGSERIRCRLKTKALNDIVVFLERFYESSSTPRTPGR